MEALNKPISVIASEAMQSKWSTKSKTSGSSRPCGVRDDGLVQFSPNALKPFMFQSAQPERFQTLGIHAENIG